MVNYKVLVNKRKYLSCKHFLYHNILFMFRCYSCFSLKTKCFENYKKIYSLYKLRTIKSFQNLNLSY